LKDNLKTLLEEPGCSHNRTKSDKDKLKKCSKPTPGAASGGCAFDGAQIVLLPIADAAHLIHSPINCSQSWDNRGTRSINKEPFYRYGFTTMLNETDIVFGSESKLLSAIKEIDNKYKPSAIFVYNTCVTAMIGENIEDVCKKASKTLKTPIIPVDAPGFIGSKNLGNKLAGDALFRYVIGTGEPDYTTKYDINIIGEYNIAGELWQVLPLFRELGIRVLSKITGDSSYRELTYAHKAKANVVICSKALVSLARRMHEKYGIPYFEGSFYGIRETSKTLRKFTEILGDKNLQLRTEELIKLKELETNNELSILLPYLKDKKAFVYSGGVKSWSIVYQLEELGVQAIGTSTRKSTENDIEKLREHFEGTQKILMEKGSGKEILDILDKEKADFFLAGGRNLYTAVKGKYPYIDVNQERIQAYAGYKGMVNLAKRIIYTLYSPVFKTAKTDAPWDLPHKLK